MTEDQNTESGAQAHQAELDEVEKTLSADKEYNNWLDRLDDYERN